MDNKRTSLHSTFSINGEMSNEDTRFLSITIDVLHTGKNLNDSFFTREVVDSCIESIKNTPVLGFISFDNISQEYDFKGHERVVVMTEDGIEEKYLGSAYGVIPESCNPRWITKVCPDGQEREFLQVDALLWTKFDDSTGIVKSDIEKSQSMELEVSSIEGEDDENGVFHFSSFKFDGCCILGDNVTPAMTGANVKVNEVQFAMDDFMKSIQCELNDKFEAFNKLIIEKGEQGGVSDMDKNTDFSQTILQQFEDIANIVEQYETFEDRWGDSVPRFYLTDIQDEEVIVSDRKDSYRYYGFPFTVNGDKPEIDFACGGKRKKVRYENYEDGSVPREGMFDLGQHIADIEEAAFNKVTEAEAKAAEVEQSKADVETEYEKVKTEYEEIKPKYDEYVQAEAQREAEELSAQKDAKFSEYEDVLGENADFHALKEKKDEMSVDEIEKECAVMFVKASRANQINFSKANSGSAIVDVLKDDDSADDGYVHTKYGDIRKAR